MFKNRILKSSKQWMSIEQCGEEDDENNEVSNFFPSACRLGIN